jgi:hypothetical protein
MYDVRFRFLIENEGHCYATFLRKRLTLGTRRLYKVFLNKCKNCIISALLISH